MSFKSPEGKHETFYPTVKPSMPETTALGAAMAAGAAEGVSVWSLNPEDLSEVTSEKSEPQINTEGTPAPRPQRSQQQVNRASVCLQRVSSATLAGRRRCRNP